MGQQRPWLGTAQMDRALPVEDLYRPQDQKLHWLERYSPARPKGIPKRCGCKPIARASRHPSRRVPSRERAEGGVRRGGGSDEAEIDERRRDQGREPMHGGRASSSGRGDGGHTTVGRIDGREAGMRSHHGRVLALALVVAATGCAPTPGTRDTAPSPTPGASPAASTGAFFLDLRTGEQTPLPSTRVGDSDSGVRLDDGHYYAVSPDSSMVYWEDTCCLATDVAAVARSDGSQVRRLDPRGPINYYAGGWSPDGTKIAFTGPGPGTDIYVMNPDGTEQTRLLNSVTLSGWNPSWSPDGRRLTFSAHSESPTGGAIFVADPQGGALEQFGPGGMSPVWSPDGSRIAYVGRTQQVNQPILTVVRPDGTDPQVLSLPANSSISEERPVWTPDSAALVTVVAVTVEDQGQRETPCLVDADIDRGHRAAQLTAGPLVQVDRRERGLVRAQIARQPLQHLRVDVDREREHLRPVFLTAPQPVDDRIASDGVQPRRAGSSLAVVAACRAPDRGEGVLHRVLGPAAIAEPPERQAEDGPGVTAVQLVERGGAVPLIASGHPSQNRRSPDTRG